VRTVDAAELAELQRVPYTEKEVLSETGAITLFGDPAYTLPERKGSRPTLEINGMWSGYTGPGGKTIIPATAHAKITCRMVPFMTPSKIAEQLAAYIKQIAPAATDVQVELFDGTPGLLIERESPFVTAAAQAAQETYGNPPIFELEGGSIPVVGDFQQLLGKPIVLLGFGLNDDNVHSPNERYALACWEKGIEASIRFLAKL
jgi:acetylornithine deacetylase/succinyl-diaminopimelate desuccinylase-like protein